MIKASKDNSQWISPLEVQGGAESDWADSQLDVEYLPLELTIATATTTNLEVTGHGYSNGDGQVRLWNSTDGLKDIDIVVTDVDNLDITSASLTEAPTKAFFNTNIQLRTSIADTDKSVVEALTNLPIDATSSDTELVTTVEVQDGDKLIVNGSELVASGVTFDDPLYTIPTTELPTKAYKVNNKELTIGGTPELGKVTVIKQRDIAVGDTVILGDA